MRHALTQTAMALNLTAVTYFVALNTTYLVFCIVAFYKLREHRRRWTPRQLDPILRSPATPGISVVVPAYNEETTIAESLRSLLLLNYPQFEVVVVNDGSKDRTLQVLIDTFGLARAPSSHEQPIATQLVRGVYRSLTHTDLVVIDKVNGGGKADAVNAGINAARSPLVCIIDADCVLEDDSLARAVLPFIEDSDTLAAGGIVRIVNGCTVEAGRVTRVGLPDSWLARFQVVEYLRAFLAGRVTHSAMNMLLIVSGAFGVFRRDAVVAIGGLRPDTIGEDMELVTRLHRWALEQRRRYRIVFQPDPVCWTEAPESLEMLGNQRNRWQRGTMQVLRYHVGMLGRPRYRGVGMVALPYYLVVEAAGPIIELGGYVSTALALACGLLDWRFAQLLLIAGALYGALISVGAVVLEELSFRRYPRARDLLVLAALGALENLGYRQLTLWWRLRGTIDYVRNKQGWGAMTRKGFARA